MSPTGLVLLFSISCALSLQNGQHKSLMPPLGTIPRKHSDLEINAPNYGGNPMALQRYAEQLDRDQERLRNEFERLSTENELEREFGQAETIGDGFQNVQNFGSFPIYAEPAQRSSNFRERERSRAHTFGDRELMEPLLEDSYGIERTHAKEPPTIYRLGQMNGNMDDDYEGQDPEDFLEYKPAVERRNVNARYPLGRDLRTYYDMAKRFPVAKRSLKPMTKKRQVTDMKVAQDLASLFNSQPTENTHQTTTSEHNHTFNINDHTTVHPLSTSAPKKEERSQSLKNKEQVLDVQKKSVDWSDYFGYDRRKKKATLSARPGSQNQDDAFFLQHYYSTMGDNLQSYKRNGESDLGDGYYSLQDLNESEEGRERLLNFLATVFTMQKLHQAIRNLQNNNQQDNQYPGSYEGIDYDRSDERHAGREGIYPVVRKRLSMPYVS